jgi:TonB family protein
VSSRIAAAILAVVIMAGAVRPYRALGQASQSSEGEEIQRRAKTKVYPDYPELARRMNLTGIVRVSVTVGPNGTVKEAHVAGGHPVLAGAALEAAKKWRFEPASGESSGIIDFKFEPR